MTTTEFNSNSKAVIVGLTDTGEQIPAASGRISTQAGTALEILELSKDAIDYSVEEDYRTNYTPKQNESVELVTCPYFTTSVYDLTEDMTLDYSELDSFVIHICMEGSCTVTDDEGNSVEVKAGESILYAATTKEVKVTVNGHAKFLETYV